MSHSAQSTLQGFAALSELIDDPHYLVNELEKLNVDGYHIHISKEKKNGITGTYVDVHLEHEHMAAVFMACQLVSGYEQSV